MKRERLLLSGATGYLMSVLLIGVVTLLGEAMKTAVHPTNLAMLYFIALIVVALRWGKGPAVFTAIAGVLCFDYFLVPPYNAFAVADIDYLFTFAIFLGVGLSISSLVLKTRQQAAEAKEKEIQAQYLMQTEKLQSALLHSISHDLRTPLVSITGALSGVLNDPLLQGEETRKELLTSAYSESRRLNTLVDNLLDMTRIDAGTLKLHLEPCDLKEIVRASLESLKDRIEKRPVHLDVAYDVSPISVDFKLMATVFTNLLDNAIKYSDPGSPIEIRIRRMRDGIGIDIEDEGFGVPDEELEKIFDKFFRAPQTRRINGTGLGLSICRGIIEAHKGKIWAENRGGKGLRISVKLPLEDA